MNKICKKHGNTEHSLRKDKRWICKECNKERVKKRRKKLKEKSVEYKGGCCEKCGYNKCISALEFHHIDPETKSFGISSSGNTYSWVRVKKELDKCIMLCANCHREEHS